jgi:hypothetical protein
VLVPVFCASVSATDCASSSASTNASVSPDISSIREEPCVTDDVMFLFVPARIKK